MQIALIAVVDQNLAIGRGGDQLAYIGGDLRRFKQLTTGQAIVMGRKTFAALPKGALPKRQNIVLTRDAGLQLPGCSMATTPEAALRAAAGQEQCFIIGGGEIYKAFLPLAHRLYLTHIHHRFEGADTWFPQWLPGDWQSVESGPTQVDEKTGLHYHYETLERR